MPPKGSKCKSDEGTPTEPDTSSIFSAHSQDTLSIEPKRQKKSADADDANGNGEDERHKIRSAQAVAEKRFVTGDPSRPSTFGACHQNEARVAALVGYKDMASFWPFLLSPSFLKYYLLFDTDWSKGMRVVAALEQIRDVWLAGNIRKTFSTS
ncbi:hypothetical protein MBLNU13_g03307t1 [Cladosporium sp. NU13]